MHGRLEAIWIKRAHRGVMDPVDSAQLVEGKGIEGNVDRSRRRQVTLLDADVWQSCMTQLGASVDPRARRANLLVRGVVLPNTRGRVLCIGAQRLLIGGELTPCERMDEVIPGLQALLRPEWHGGVFAQVLTSGEVHVGDDVRWEQPESLPATA